MKKNILVLGAGMTGLAAAWKLLKSTDDYHITVLERDSVPGGLAKTIDWNGFKLDLGPHRFHTEIPEIREFIRSFCQEHMIHVQRHSRMYLNGHYIPYPISILQTFRALGLWKTLRFSASAFGVLLNGNTQQADSYEDYVKNYYGDSLYQYIFKPFAEKVWGIPPARIAAETARVRLRGDSIWHALKDSLLSRQETYVSEFLYPEGGMGEIAQKFADEIEAHGGQIRYQHTAREILLENGRVARVRVDSDAGEKELPCDLLINTIPLPRFIGLFREQIPAAIHQAAQNLHFRALVLLYVLYDRKYEIRDTWLYYPEEHVSFSRISVPGNFLPTRHYGDKTCLCVEFTCEVGDEIWNASSEELAAPVNQLLTQSGLIDHPAVDTLTVHIKDGYPVYHIGYEQSLNQTLNHLRTLQNCITAGRQGLFRHNNIDQAIQMGLESAQHITARPEKIDSWYDGVDRFKNYRIVD